MLKLGQHNGSLEAHFSIKIYLITKHFQSSLLVSSFSFAAHFYFNLFCSINENSAWQNENFACKIYEMNFKPINFKCHKVKA